ncbi:SEC-C metal-binding domain-containing protein [Actinomadura bangladeshensis]
MDSQFATAERISLLTAIGRTDEADAEIARLSRSHVDPGPAELIAESLEGQGRLDEALTWFTITCRDLMADDGELADSRLFARPELRGRQRVRRALGLPPAGSFFVRADVGRAFAEGLVHGTAPTLAWPPERNAPCWCGSGRKYKKCCGSPTDR